jgi:hypothetical protein
MRRKLPNARILLGCWATDVDAKTLLEAAKPDEVATTLSDAVRMCIEAADNTKHSSLTIDAKVSA